MKPQDAINYYKTRAALARAFTPPLTRGAINYWEKVGFIPKGRAYELQIITKGELKIDPSVYVKPLPSDAA